MMSSGQIMAQELKLQMGDQLPGAMRAMARAAHNLGITQDDSVESMNAAMSAGKLMSEEILPEFANELWKASNQGGALEESINNTNAAFGRFRTNVWMANKTLNESGLDKGIRDVTNSFSTFIFESEKLWDFLGSTFGFFTQLLRGPIEFFTVLSNEFTRLTETANEFGLSAQQVVGAFSLLIPLVRRTLVPLVVLAYSLSAASRAWEEGGFWNWATAFAGIAASIYFLRSPLTKLVRWAGNASRAMGKFWESARGVKSPKGPTIPETIRAPAQTSTGTNTAAERLRQRVSKINAERVASETATQSSKGLGRFLGPLGAILAGKEGAEKLWDTNIAKFLSGRGYGTMEDVLYPPMGRPNALTVQEQQQARQMVVNGDIRFEIDGQDGPQIADEVIRVINENFIRPTSVNEPVSER